MRTRLPHDWRAAANHEPRKGGKLPDMLLLHYTGMKTAEAAINWLASAESQVSCHYVIDEQGRITQMVSEVERAWHAGVSFWKGERDINSTSVGIEIHNPGHELGYVDFPPAQMDAVMALCKEIVARHNIRPDRIIGHNDIAPGRGDDLVVGLAQYRREGRRHRVCGQSDWAVFLAHLSPGAAQPPGFGPYGDEFFGQFSGSG